MALAHSDWADHFDLMNLFISCQKSFSDVLQKAEMQKLKVHFPKMLAAEAISKSITDTWWHEEELHIPAPDGQAVFTHHCPRAKIRLYIK